mmetsp:Transcript_9174/g.37504  ORF Transcript_9174/g.37504 Transcript_9174/m.37504 type:complete len:331 (-) Transcript_9174:182-1174(-)
MRDGGEEHLDADEKILHGGRDLRGVVVRLCLSLRHLDPLHLDHEQQGLALPEGEEHDRFHGAKLVKRADGRELLVRRPVEYDQAVHRPRLGHVVEQRQVRVRHERVQDLAVPVHAVGFADERQRGGQRTHHDVVDHPVPAQPQKGLSHPRKVQERRYGPYVPRRGFPGDDLLQTRVAKLLQVHCAVGVKVVDDVRLVALADCVEVDGAVLEPQRQPAVDGVYGHHEEYADDVPLQPRHPVVLEVLRHLVEGYGHGEEDEHAGDEPGDEMRGAAVAVHVPRAQRERDEHDDVDEDPHGLEDLAKETGHHRALVAILALHHRRVIDQPLLAC